jgi:small subunit ribosomal protein S20
LANTKSALKRVRVSERRRIRNRRYRSASRTLSRGAIAQINQQNTESAAEEVKRAISMLDRAANKGIIHRNNAARRKSRLMAKYNRLVQEQP